jgi:hypothetical protein
MYRNTICTCGIKQTTKQLLQCYLQIQDYHIYKIKYNKYIEICIGNKINYYNVAATILKDYLD